MRNKTNKFFHFELLSGEILYTLWRAWNPDMVLTCPTAKEVPKYSFSNSPYQIVISNSINTHMGQKDWIFWTYYILVYPPSFRSWIAKSIYLNRVRVKGYIWHWIHPHWSRQSISNSEIACWKHHDHLKWHTFASVASSGNS